MSILKWKHNSETDICRCVNGHDVHLGDECIPERYLCNRRNDCSDGSDEKDCEYTCKEDMFKCERGILAR